MATFASYIDMLNEEYVEKITKFNSQCCLTHAVAKIDINHIDFDPALRKTVQTMRKLLERISP